MAADREILGHSELQRHAGKGRQKITQGGRFQDQHRQEWSTATGHQSNEGTRVAVTQQVCLPTLELSPETGDQINNDNNFAQVRLPSSWSLILTTFGNKEICLYPAAHSLGWNLKSDPLLPLLVTFSPSSGRSSLTRFSTYHSHSGLHSSPSTPPCGAQQRWVRREKYAKI